MAVKTTGEEWKKFYADKTFWYGDIWHEEEEISIDGVEAEADADLGAMADDAKIVITGGIVFVKEDDENNPSLESYFKKWRKIQKTAYLNIEVPIELLDAVKAAIIAAGGKVKS